jgi:hypothetical protein
MYIVFFLLLLVPLHLTIAKSKTTATSLGAATTATTTTPAVALAFAEANHDWLTQEHQFARICVSHDLFRISDCVEFNKCKITLFICRLVMHKTDVFDFCIFSFNFYYSKNNVNWVDIYFPKKVKIYQKRLAASFR